MTKARIVEGIEVAIEYQRLGMEQDDFKKDDLLVARIIHICIRILKLRLTTGEYICGTTGDVAECARLTGVSFCMSGISEHAKIDKGPTTLQIRLRGLHSARRSCNGYVYLVNE